MDLVQHETLLDEEAMATAARPAGPSAFHNCECPNWLFIRREDSSYKYVIEACEPCVAGLLPHL